MTPGEASAQGTTLAILHPVGGRRVAAHAFDLAEGGVAWIDSGWTRNDTGHTAHLLEGEIDEIPGEGWLLTTDDDEIAIVPHDEQPTDPEGDRAAAREAIERSLGVTIR